MTDHYPPGPEGDSWVAAFEQDRLNMFMDAQRTYGNLVHFPVGKKRHLYLVTEPEYVEYVLVDHPEQFGRGIMFKRRAGKMVGGGLLTSEGEINKRNRRLMQPAFHHSRIGYYAQMMIQETLNTIERWQPADPVDIHAEMVDLTMRIVAQTLFGTDVSETALQIGRAITEGIMYLNDEKLPEPTAAFEALDRLVADMIAQRRADGEDRGDLLSMLLMAHDEDGSGMSDKQIRDEVVTLFIAGHETSANALAWAWYLLSQSPDVAGKLAHELDTVLAGRCPAPQDRLPYTDMVIKEVLRLYSPIWNQTREVLEDVQLGEYSIAKGSTIVISPFIMHHDPQNFDDPECFDPERFAEGRERQIKRGAYIPFSVGPRVCIGQSFAVMELRLILAIIAQRYRLILAPDQDIEIEPFIALRPRFGMMMIPDLRV
jgi:cytochrome P450